MASDEEVKAAIDGVRFRCGELEMLVDELIDSLNQVRNDMNDFHTGMENKHILFLISMLNINIDNAGYKIGDAIDELDGGHEDLKYA